MRIDTSLIQGFDTMTPEEQVKALQDYEFDDKSSELNKELSKVKNSLSNANAEAKKWKDAYNSQLSEEEQKNNATKELIETLQTKLNEVEGREKIANYKANLLKQGYSEELAAKAANAYHNGESEAFFNYQQEFLTAHDKALAAELLKATPNPKGGQGDGSAPMALEAFRKLSTAERWAYAKEHPEEYERMYADQK